MVRSIQRAIVAAGLLACVAGGAARADVIFDTGTPDGGFFGFIGYDVFVEQTVTVSFVPSTTCTLDAIGVWFMSNDFDNPGRTYTLSLQGGVPGDTVWGQPSGVAIESWSMATGAVGWSPVLDLADSGLHPTLNAGTRYWIVAESNEEPFVDPVWVWGSDWTPVVSGNIDFFSGPNWQIGETSGSAPGTVVWATPVPGPATIAVLGVGTLIGARRRRS
ncbi:MAG TPA: hypothetical protein VG797_05245 [Phycisphaerales bacterium]|nr:hypothetical protein [Phycisphaerales bacterium]